MTAITDFSTPVALVRLLISDIDAADPILSDEALTALLTLASDQVKGAAATALLIIATNEVLVQKQIRLLDLSTNGPAQAQALMALSAQYRKEAEIEASGGSIGWLTLPEVATFGRRPDADWEQLQSGTR